MDDPLNDPNPARSPQAWRAYKNALAALTPEQREARHKARWEALTPEQQAEEIAEAAYIRGWGKRG